MISVENATHVDPDEIIRLKTLVRRRTQICELGFAKTNGKEVHVVRAPPQHIDRDCTPELLLRLAKLQFFQCSEERLRCDMASAPFHLDFVFTLNRSYRPDQLIP